MTPETLDRAQALLDELIEAAKTGAIIPVRLPGQLEVIKNLLESQPHAADTSAAPEKAEATSTGSEELLKEQAYFVSHAVHELRTPLTSIRGYSDMLRGLGELNDMQKQCVETIRSNSRRMETLLTDVSDTAKLKGGTLRTSLKMDMFKNIALMVEKQAQPLTEELGRKLTFDIPQGLPILNVDGELLAKALYKLVENALRYSGDNGEVTVRGSADGSKLTITVQDNGIGMTPEDMNQLGTIYFRSDNEVVRSYKGSGLGIPVAYGIIHLLGGIVTIASEPNKGTTFTITLTGMS
ncbi:MAG: HAMP domain-containing histidine kinase [Anaerolineae bacterium]|nr:HAMP domain-containing histidine kinase [Anaerolineae bacterium]